MADIRVTQMSAEALSENETQLQKLAAQHNPRLLKHWPVPSECAIAAPPLPTADPSLTPMQQFLAIQEYSSAITAYVQQLREQAFRLYGYAVCDAVDVTTSVTAHESSQQHTAVGANNAHPPTAKSSNMEIERNLHDITRAKKRRVISSQINATKDKAHQMTATNGITAKRFRNINTQTDTPTPTHTDSEPVTESGLPNGVRGKRKKMRTTNEAPKQVTTSATTAKTRHVMEAQHSEAYSSVSLQDENNDREVLTDELTSDGSSSIKAESVVRSVNAETCTSGPPSPRKRHMCVVPHCHMSFDIARELARHRQTHVNEQCSDSASTEKDCGNALSHSDDTESESDGQSEDSAKIAAEKIIPNRVEGGRVNTRCHKCTHKDCGRMFVSKDHLMDHMRTHIEVHQYICEYTNCNMSFAHSTSLAKHTHRHGNTEEKHYICSYAGCDREFAHKNTMETHSLIHTGKRSYICCYSDCEKSFASASKLKEHTRTHTGERPFGCSYSECQKTFARVDTLKKHMRTHTGERPNICSYLGCQKSFAKPGHLTSHMRTHTGERPYVCTYRGCRKTFTTSGSLKRHIRLHTGERPFVCSYSDCQKSYTQSGHLKGHMRTHTGERLYVCDYPECQKAFTLSSHLNSHLRTHTGDRPYVCSYSECEKSFAYATQLEKHLRAHTGE